MSETWSFSEALFISQMGSFGYTMQNIVCEASNGMTARSILLAVNVELSGIVQLFFFASSTRVVTTSSEFLYFVQKEISDAALTSSFCRLKFVLNNIVKHFQNWPLVHWCNFSNIPEINSLRTLNELLRHLELYISRYSNSTSICE